MGNEISLRDKMVLDKFSAAAFDVIDSMREYEERGETVIGIELHCCIQCEREEKIEDAD